MNFLGSILISLVVSTPLKNMLVKMGSFPQVRAKTQNIWNHQLVSETPEIAQKNIKKS